MQYDNLSKEQIHRKLETIAELSKQIQDIEAEILKDIPEKNHDELIDIFMKVEELTYNVDDAHYAIEKVLSVIEDKDQKLEENDLEV